MDGKKELEKENWNRGKFTFQTKDGEIYGIEYFENKTGFIYTLCPISTTMFFKNEAYLRLEEMKNNLDPLIDKLIEGNIIFVKKSNKEVVK